MRNKFGIQFIRFMKEKRLLSFATCRCINCYKCTDIKKIFGFPGYTKDEESKFIPNVGKSLPHCIYHIREENRFVNI